MKDSAPFYVFSNKNRLILPYIKTLKQVNDFPGYELIVISACVLGGFLKGGLGKVSYVVASVLISGAVESAMNLLNISPFAQCMVRG